MAISELIEEFKKVSASPKTMLAKYKGQGKKVIGCLPYYVPEELVYAAGMVPMGIWGSNGKQQIRSKEYCATFYCTIAQQSLEMLLDGTLDDIDGIITPVLCDTLRPMSQNFKVAMKDKMPVIFLAHPQVRMTHTMKSKAIWKKSAVMKSPMMPSLMPSKCIIAAVRPAANSAS